MVSILVNSSSFWYISLDSVSTLILFPAFVVIFNHINASVQMLLICYNIWVQFDLLCFVDFVSYSRISIVVKQWLFWNYYDDKYKTCCRIFNAIYNLYIEFYKSDLRKHSDVGEHVGFEPPSSFSLLTWVLLFWMSGTYFSHSSQLNYWWKASG